MADPQPSYPREIYRRVHREDLPVRYVHGDIADGLRNALDALWHGVERHIHNPANSPEDFAELNACMERATRALAQARGDGGEA